MDFWPEWLSMKRIAFLSGAMTFARITLAFVPSRYVPDVPYLYRSVTQLVSEELTIWIMYSERISWNINSCIDSNSYRACEERYYHIAGSVQLYLIHTKL